MKEEPLVYEELQLFSRRDLIIRSIIGIPFAGIVWRLWNLQIPNGEMYSNLSKGNRIRLVSEASPRGIIYDRNSVIVARNIPSYTLLLIREDTDDVAMVLRKVSQTLKIPLHLLERALKNNRKEAQFHPIQLYENLSFRQIALIGTYQEEFPGISIKVTPKRYYPVQKTAAHICGYISQITKSQLDNLPFNKLQSAKNVGQDGVESVYNQQLIGTDGGRQIEVDNTGREIREFPNPIEPVPGKDIVLTINIQLQQKIEQIMTGQKGAVIVMNPENGEVLSMVSLPAFDPNEFSQGISTERWREMKNDASQVLNNKAIKGVYSPGSTFKMVVAAAAIEMGIIDEESVLNCEGYVTLGRTRFHCWKRSGHGNLNVVGALENSCNVFFYKVALEIGVDKIKQYANRFGFGNRTGIDLLNENVGNIPDQQWYQRQFKQNWKHGQTLNAAIGQGFVAVTPIQLLNYAAIIANSGFKVKPRLVKSVATNLTGSEAEKNKQKRKLEQIYGIRERVDINSKTMELLQDGMTQNVQGENGTGRVAQSDIISIAGKTGTTQVIGNKTRNRILKEKGELEKIFLDHAWFIAYASIENPKVSTVVMLENGRSGSNAARLTKEIMEYYFTKVDPQLSRQMAKFAT
ncbi:MAG: penicillin-binding protein 2 [SAR324 cluster bacterium]|nr:penicillin-binding protein 2 [SAR324 cluster bacterium]